MREAFIDRVIVERDELKIKYDKLIAFIESDKFCEVEKPEDELLVLQSCHMERYLNVLNQRIKLHGV